MADIVFSKSSDVNNSVFGKSEAPIRAFLESRIAAAEKESLTGLVFKTVKSNKFAEKFTQLTSLKNGFRPTEEGGNYPDDERQEGYSKTLEPWTWLDRFKVTREMIEDNVALDMSRVGATGFADRFRDGRDAFSAAALVGGLTATTFTFMTKIFDCSAADGKPLFATDHPSITSGTAAQSNKFAGAFTAETLGQVSTAMQNFKDDNGMPLSLMPDTIIIPNDYRIKQAVFAAIGADKDPGSANNGFNYLFGQWRVVISPYLNAMITEGDTPWMIMDSKYNTNYNGLLLIDRVGLEVRSWIDNNNDCNVWNARYRSVVGFNDWRAIAVGGVTGGTALT